jgi:hypothetical protein
LQALTLLNDEQFYEFAQALAKRVSNSSSQTEAEKIDTAFRLCLGRAPSETERSRLHKLASENSDEKWLMIARVLLNLDETITRE